MIPTQFEAFILGQVILKYSLPRAGPRILGKMEKKKKEEEKRKEEEKMEKCGEKLREETKWETRPIM